MSRPIKLSAQDIETLCSDFREKVKNSIFPNGKINFVKSFADTKQKATLYFTDIAYFKMQALVRQFDVEVAWHGIVKRVEDSEKNEYIVSDIIVFPQTVTGATVDTDQVKYQNWLFAHDDEVFNNIRMHGHSHVNMNTSPSNVDETYYQKVLNDLGDEGFYIFGIWNKRNEKTIRIYDLTKNIIFEPNDITVSIINDTTGIKSFIEDAKEMVNTLPRAYRGNYDFTREHEHGYFNNVDDYDYDYDYEQAYYSGHRKSQNKKGGRHKWT